MPNHHLHRSAKSAPELAAYFKALTEHSSDVITVMRESGVVMYHSHSVDKVTGFPKHVMNRKHIMEGIHNSDRLRVIRAFKLIEGRKNAMNTVVYRFKAKDGEWRWIESVMRNLVGDKTVDGIVVNSRDITQRMKAERSLQLSTDILHAIGTLVIVANKKGEVVYVGSSVEKLLGYTPEQLTGDGWWRLTFGRGATGKNMQYRVKHFNKKNTNAYERKVKCADGSYKWFLWQDTEGPEGLVIGVGNDITRQKEAMQNYQESEELLRAKNAELDTFVYKASHDLKGPLASILGLVNVMKNETSNEDTLEYIDMIKQSTIRLDSILMDLLQITRIKKGTIERSAIDFRNTIQDIRSSLANMPGYADVNIRLFVETSKEFTTDRKLLTSILQNLIDNAIKYRDQDSDLSYVYLAVTDHKHGVKIRVVDNGVGVPEDMQAKVFDMFFRASNDSKGTGLGLYIVKNSIDKLGGKIKMESEPGRGTHFVIFLPNMQSSGDATGDRKKGSVNDKHSTDPNKMIA